MVKQKVIKPPFFREKGNNDVEHRLYMTISTFPGKPRKARLLLTSKNILRRMLKRGCIAEYRACSGILQAASMVLVYNCRWATCLYRKARGLKRGKIGGKREAHGNEDD